MGPRSTLHWFRSVTLHGDFREHKLRAVHDTLSAALLLAVLRWVSGCTTCRSAIAPGRCNLRMAMPGLMPALAELSCPPLSSTGLVVPFSQTGLSNARYVPAWPMIGHMAS